MIHGEWREILEFPSYSVSDTGFVRNEDYGKDHEIRMMTQHVNQHGIVNVSFNRRGQQYKRSVAVLVATAFVTAAKSLSFDTPINLDGDRLNNCADNLLWRPRWYATQYFRQFIVRSQGIDRPVQEFKTEEIFDSSWHAAVSLGLLESEIVNSVIYKTYARSTYHRFRVVH
jgi:hypothetical protein